MTSQPSLNPIGTVSESGNKPSAAFGILAGDVSGTERKLLADVRRDNRRWARQLARERLYGVDHHAFYKAWFWIQMALLTALTVVMILWPTQAAQFVHDALDQVRFSGVGAWW